MNQKRNRNWTLSVLFVILYCVFFLLFFVVVGNVGCPFLYFNWLIAVEV